MKLETKYKIENATSDDATRMSLLGVYFDNQTAVATNGKIMAIVPCEHLPEEQGKLVYADNLKAIRKAQGTKVDHVEATLNGEVKATGKNGETLSFKLNECTFPNYKQVLPSKDRPVKMKFALDAALLLELAKAIGAGQRDQFHVTLELSDALDPIKVTCTNSRQSIGVIMPVRVMA